MVHVDVAADWRPIPTELDAIESLTVDIASGPASGSVSLLAAQSGTIADRRAQAPYFLLDFSDVEMVTASSDTMYSILGERGGSAATWLSESTNSRLIADVHTFRGNARHFVLRGSWDHFEIVASSFSIRRFDSEMAARTGAVEAVMS
jgi:hypothetical protein